MILDDVHSRIAYFGKGTLITTNFVYEPPNQGNLGGVMFREGIFEEESPKPGADLGAHLPNHPIRLEFNSLEQIDNLIEQLRGLKSAIRSRDFIYNGLTLEESREFNILFNSSNLRILRVEENKRYKALLNKIQYPSGELSVDRLKAMIAEEQKRT